MLWSLGAWAVLLLIAPGALAVEITFPSGRSGCDVVHFPRWSVPRDAEDKYNYPWKGFLSGSVYQFRHAEDTPRNRMLVRVALPWLNESNAITSPDIYWLELNGVPQVRQASEAQWDSGVPLPNIMGPRPMPRPPGNNRPIDYEGRSFPKKGQEWAIDYGGVSSNGSWLSTASMTVHKRSRDGVALSATTYVDVFHVQSGKLVVAVTGTLSDFDMLRSKANSGYFIDDQFFVAGLGANRRSMLICDLDRLAPGH